MIIKKKLELIAGNPIQKINKDIVASLLVCCNKIVK